MAYFCFQRTTAGSSRFQVTDVYSRKAGSLSYKYNSFQRSYMNSRKHNKTEVVSETTDLTVQTLHSANEYIMPGVHKFPQKSWKHLKILGTGWITFRKFQSGNLKILGAVVKKFIRPGDLATGISASPYYAHSNMKNVLK